MVKLPRHEMLWLHKGPREANEPPESTLLLCARDPYSRLTSDDTLESELHCRVSESTVLVATADPLE